MSNLDPHMPIAHQIEWAPEERLFEFCLFQHRDLRSEKLRGPMCGELLERTAQGGDLTGDRGHAVDGRAGWADARV